MIHLAELNENGICISVKTTKNMIDDGRHVEIETPDFDYYVWRKYENGQWSQEKYPPETESAETIEEKLDRLERDFQESKLVQYDALATIFEEILLLQDKLNGGGTND